jgi:hypothetical protein
LFAAIIQSPISAAFSRRILTARTNKAIYQSDRAIALWSPDGKTCVAMFEPVGYNPSRLTLLRKADNTAFLY